MATMLGFVTTDAKVEPALLQRALQGRRGRHLQRDHGRRRMLDQRLRLRPRERRQRVELVRRRLRTARRGLDERVRPLAIGIVRGGEGATKLITVRVVGAVSSQDARQAARAIANSLLVKTAIHGGDPNWGRLVAVAGRSGSEFVLERAAVRIGPVELFSGGGPHDERAARGRRVSQGTRHRRRSGPRHGRDGQLGDVDLRLSSAEYVRINADTGRERAQLSYSCELQTGTERSGSEAAENDGNAELC